MKYQNILCLLLIVLKLREMAAEKTWLKWTLPEAKDSRQTVDHAAAQYFVGKTTVLKIGVYVERANLWSLTNMMRNFTELSFIRGEDTSRQYLYNIFYVDTATAFGKHSLHTKNTNVNSSGYYVIILHPKSKLEVRKLLRIAFRRQITNIAVLICESHMKCIVYSYYVFQPGQCRKVQPVVVNRFRNGHFAYPELFPEKFANFHNCPIYVLPRIINIYSLLHSSLDPRNKKITLHGIEAELLHTIAKSLNFSISVNPECLNNECEYGDVGANGTTTGAFRFLTAKSVDMVIGYMPYKSHRAAKFAQSMPYLISHLAGVAINTESARRFTWVWEPFRYKIWTLICLFVLIGTLLTTVSNRANWSTTRNCATWLDVLGIVVGVPRPVFGTRSWWRYPLLAWCASFVVLIAAYQGQLYVKHNSVAPTPSIQMKDIFLNNYTVIAHASISILQFEPIFEVFKDRLLIVDSNELLALFETLSNSSGKKVVFAPLYAVYQYVLDHHHQPEVLQRFNPTEPLFSQYVCTYFQPHSYLVAPINKIIGGLITGGFVSKWLADWFFSKLRQGLAHKMQLLAEPKVLGMETFGVLFFALVVLHLIAFLTFLGEVVGERWKRKLRGCIIPANPIRRRVRRPTQIEQQ